MRRVKIHRNTNEGTQVEWRGLLLTLRRNRDHGISGSLVDGEGGGKGRHTLQFHGKSDDQVFPLVVHVEGGAKHRVNRTSAEYFQGVWRLLLLTLSSNPAHGISGSVGVRTESDRTQLLEFHGRHPEQWFPLVIHEEEVMDSEVSRG